MTATRVLRAAGPALAATIGVVLLGSPAAADTGSVPPTIANWFTQEAPRVAGGVLGAGAVGAGPRLAATGYTVGSPVQLHNWDPSFLAGTANQVVVASDEWVTTLYRNGAVVGTIAATVSPAGRVAMSYVDDDVVAGRALAAGAVSGKVVHDSRMGGLLQVKPNGAAQGLSAVAASTVTSVDDTTELRAAVGKAHDRNSWDNSADGAAVGGGVGAGDRRDGTAFLTGLAVALAGLVLLLVWRRTAARRRA